ncbi:MAG TPA: hypothetical protein VK986_03095, partial [Tepidisphaeraceae bacterium]|nr:hypothetical protein [Tepidisphaeraceae bacterium]
GGLGQGTEAGDEAEEVPVATGAVPPDGQPRKVTLKATSPGLHRVWISDGSDSTRTEWPADVARTIKVDPETRAMFSGRRAGYFYVPRETKVVGGYSSGDGDIHGPDGKRLFELPKGGEFFKVDVPAGQDGKVWSVRNAAGTIGLMTVPPYVAPSPKQLLLPKGVVEADR